jgi:hypothetical protein
MSYAHRGLYADVNYPRSSGVYYNDYDNLRVVLVLAFIIAAVVKSTSVNDIFRQQRDKNTQL